MVNSHRFLFLISFIVFSIVFASIIPKTYAANTQLSVTVFLHGIGKGGDSANANSGGNTSPKSQQKDVSIGVFNAQNVLVSSSRVTATYSATDGNYKATVDLGSLASGSYNVAIRSDKYLQKTAAGIQNITSGKSNTIAPVRLIAGDILIDNMINIQDFNMLMNCYADLTPAKACTTAQSSLADLTDDGNVNQLDYNLFIREIGNRSGEANPTSTITSAPTVNPTTTKSPTPNPSGSNASLPAQILNLTNWKLQLPSGQAESPTEIKQPALATYKNDPYFVTSNGGVRFRAPVNGVTTSGSDYPRSELREMTSNGTAQASWSTSSGTHTMLLDEAITAVPVTKKHVVAGQIHDGENDVIVIRLEMPKLFIDIGGTAGPTLDTNYTLGKRFTVKFEVTGGKTNIYYNGSTTPTYTMANNYANAYFKAGAYTQSNCTKEPSNLCNANNFGEVIIYKTEVVHK